MIENGYLMWQANLKGFQFVAGLKGTSKRLEVNNKLCSII